MATRVLLEKAPAPPRAELRRSPPVLHRVPVHLAGITLFFFCLIAVERAGALLSFGAVEVLPGASLAEVALWAEVFAFVAALATVRYTNLFQGGRR